MGVIGILLIFLFISITASATQNSEMQRFLMEAMHQYNIPDLLEAKSVIQLNDDFHRATDKINQQEGKLNNEKVFFEWEESLKRYIKINYKI